MKPKFNCGFVSSLHKPWAILNFLYDRLFCTRITWIMPRHEVTPQFSCSRHRVLQSRPHTTSLPFMKGNTNPASGASKKRRKKKGRENGCRYTFESEKTCPCRHHFPQYIMALKNYNFLSSNTTFSSVCSLDSAWVPLLKHLKGKQPMAKCNDKSSWEINEHSFPRMPLHKAIFNH